MSPSLAIYLGEVCLSVLRKSAFAVKVRPKRKIKATIDIMVLRVPQSSKSSIMWGP